MAKAKVKAAVAQEGAQDIAQAASDEVVVFISAEEETGTYNIDMGDVLVRGHWDSNREHVFFHVPAELVERFSRHSHVQTGRIVRVEAEAE